MFSKIIVTEANAVSVRWCIIVPHEIVGRASQVFVRLLFFCCLLSTFRIKSKSKKVLLT